MAVVAAVGMAVLQQSAENKVVVKKLCVVHNKVHKLLNITLATRLEFPFSPLSLFFALHGEPPVSWTHG